MGLSTKPAMTPDMVWRVAVIVAIVAALFSFAAILIWAPEHAVTRLFDALESLPAPAQLGLLVGAVATAIATWRNRTSSPAAIDVQHTGASAGDVRLDPEELRRRQRTTVRAVPRDPEAGFAGIDLLAFAFWVSVAFLLGAYLAGCGASPLRQHAIAASAATSTMEAAGEAILTAQRAALASCPVDDGAERTACIDRIEGAAVGAAASRDAALPFVEGYRDAVEDAGERPEQPTPEILSVLESMGAAVARRLDVMREALEALAALARGGP